MEKDKIPPLDGVWVDTFLEDRIGEIGEQYARLSLDILRQATGRRPLALGGAGKPAKWAARRLPTTEHRETFLLELPVAQAFALARDVLAGMGEMLYPETDHDLPSLFAHVGSGFSNMNPTVLCLLFAPSGENAAITAIGVAKEGLIRQDTAHNAVLRVRQSLYDACDERRKAPPGEAPADEEPPGEEPPGEEPASEDPPAEGPPETLSPG